MNERLYQAIYDEIVKQYVKKVIKKGKVNNMACKGGRKK